MFYFLKLKNQFNDFCRPLFIFIEKIVKLTEEKGNESPKNNW